MSNREAPHLRRFCQMDLGSGESYVTIVEAGKGLKAGSDSSLQSQAISTLKHGKMFRTPTMYGCSLQINDLEKLASYKSRRGRSS